MKPLKVLIYILILCVIAAYLYVVEVRQKQKDLALKQKAEKIVHLKRDNIVGITIDSQGKGRITLRKPAKTWVLTKPVKAKADGREVDGFLTSVLNAKREKLVKDKNVTWKEFGLVKPSLKVTLLTKDKPVQLSFGAANPSKTSCYLRVDEDPKLLLVADTLKNSLNKTAFDLRDKTVVAIAEPDVDTIKVRSGDKEIQLDRDATKGWRISKPLKVKAKASEVNAALRYLVRLQAKGIIDKPKKEGDPYGLEHPEMTITLAGKKLGQTLLLGKSVDSKGKSLGASHNRYARIKERDTVYEIDGSVLKRIKTDPEELRDRSLFSFKIPDIQKIEIQLDGKTFAAARTKKDKWALTKPAEKEIETWPVTGILWALKGLEWKSLKQKGSEDLAALHLDKPKLVARLFAKGKKEPIVLKAGWPDKKSGKAKQETTAPETAPETSKDVTKKKEKTAGEEPGPPEYVNALVVPHEDGNAVFVLKGDFVNRLRNDLSKIVEKKQTKGDKKKE
jgi:hypothetical protein